MTTTRTVLPLVIGTLIATPRAARPDVPKEASDTVHIVVVATTDVHGRVFHWDYVRDEGAPWGLTRAATVVDSLRAAYPGRVVLVDAGDLIQGNPFAAFYATHRSMTPHPVVDALNAVGYDAAIPGNHEFNWGLGVLERVTSSARFPIVAGNVFGLPADSLIYPAYVLLQRDSVRVGVAGFTTPGSMVWDKANLAGRVLVRAIVPEAHTVLAALGDAGADLRVVVIHSGMDAPSSYDTTGVGAENVAAQLAWLPVKPHLVFVGHSHRTMADSVINGVHFVQPAPWARSLAIAHVWLVPADRWTGGRADTSSVRLSGGSTGPSSTYRVLRIRGEWVSLRDVEPHPRVTERLMSAHNEVRAWVSEPLARVEGDWSAREARAQDTPIIDFVNEVQRRTAGTQLSSTAAFNPGGGFGSDHVRLRDVASVYPYENLLKAIRIDGAALKAYLEQSASYFHLYRPGQPIINDSVPGYNYDIVSGVEYVIDLTRPVGQRITELTFDGHRVAPTDTFSLALNNYRQGGGGGFEMLAGLPVIYDRGENIRDLLAEFLRRTGTVRAEDYFRPSWRIAPPEAELAVRAVFSRRGSGR